jgi:hypothetical protein
MLSATNGIVLLSSLILLGVGVNVGFLLFPSYNFYWGDEIKIADNRRVISRLVIYGTLLVIGTSIVASLIASYLAIRPGGGTGGGF